MVLIDFLKDKNIDGNLYLLKDSNMKKVDMCRITGIKSIPTINKRLSYLRVNNVEIDVDNIPNYIFENLDISLLFKVWLLHKNGVSQVREIIKYCGIGNNADSVKVIERALKCIRENEGIEYKEVDSGKMNRDVLVKSLINQWNLKS